MKTNRIQPLDLPLPPEVQTEMDKIFPSSLPSPTLYRMVAKNKALFKDLVHSRMIGPTGLFDKKRIPAGLREKIILRTCVAAGNDYEFALHVQTISHTMGLTSEQIADMKQHQLNKEFWEPKELALFDLIDDLVSHIKVTDKTFKRVTQFFTEEMLLEIVFIVGLYTGVAMLVALGNPTFDDFSR